VNRGASVPSTDDQTDTETPTSTHTNPSKDWPDDWGPKIVSIVETETTGIDMDAVVVESGVTTAHTATVRLTWTNSGTDPVAVAIDREGNSVESLFGTTLAVTTSGVML